MLPCLFGFRPFVAIFLTIPVISGVDLLSGIGRNTAAFNFRDSVKT